jgi:antitoxin VapB
MNGRSGRRKQEAGPEGSTMMREAKLFMNGRSQAVRLPADCRFEGDSVYVKKWRGAVILLPRDNAWGPLLESVGSFSPDFMEGRDQAGSQGRPELDALFEDGE